MNKETLYSSDGELFRYGDIEEAITDVAENASSDMPLPYLLCVCECEFEQAPASAYLPGQIFESMDERAYDDLGEEAFGHGLFVGFEFDSDLIEQEIRTAVDAVFTKHNIQPTAMKATGDPVKHRIEWRSPDDWNIVQEGDASD